MHTKGIASVRSPVRNLQQYDDSVTHEKFVEAVIDSFRQEYSIDEPVRGPSLSNRILAKITATRFMKSRRLRKLKASSTFAMGWTSFRYVRRYFVAYDLLTRCSDGSGLSARLLSSRTTSSECSNVAPL